MPTYYSINIIFCICVDILFLIIIPTNFFLNLFLSRTVWILHFIFPSDLPTLCLTDSQVCLPAAMCAVPAASSHFSFTATVLSSLPTEIRLRSYISAIFYEKPASCCLLHEISLASLTQWTFDLLYSMPLNSLRDSSAFWDSSYLEDKRVLQPLYTLILHIDCWCLLA